MRATEQTAWAPWRREVGSALLALAFVAGSVAPLLLLATTHHAAAASVSDTDEMSQAVDPPTSQSDIQSPSTERTGTAQQQPSSRAPSSGSACGGTGESLKATYIPLVFIPFFSERDRTLSYSAVLEPGQLPVLVHTFYYLLLGVLAVAAVVLITYYGLQYTLSEVTSEKVDAKRKITDIILGFTLIIGAYVIINTINPSILSLNILGEGSVASRHKISNTCVPPEAFSALEGPEGSMPTYRIGGDPSARTW